MPAKVADEYVAFVREVRAALDEVDPELHLSVDVVAGLRGYDLAALTADDAADLAVIMGYGYRTDGAGVAGSTAPLRDPASGDLSSTRRRPRWSRLRRTTWCWHCRGTAWPGRPRRDEARSACVSGKGIDGPSEPTMRVAVGARRRSPVGATSPTRPRPGRPTPPSSARPVPPTWRQVWYDDPDSFGAKIDYRPRAGPRRRRHLGPGHGRPAARRCGGPCATGSARSSTMTPPDGSAGARPGRPARRARGPRRRRGQRPAAPVRVRRHRRLAAWRSGTRRPRPARSTPSGQLVTGRTYPAVERIEFPLGDESTGGSAEEGPRSIHVQWRDLAGNWSMPAGARGLRARPGGDADAGRPLVAPALRRLVGASSFLRSTRKCERPKACSGVCSAT